MKRFKLGFLAVIAVLAMSFTVISHESAPKKSAFAPKGVNCNNGLSSLTVDHQGTNIPLNRGITLCTSIPDVSGDCVIAPPSPTPTAILCPGAETFFCCAEVVADESCDAGYRVTQINCYNGSR